MLPAIYPEIAEGHSLGSKHLYLNGLENTMIHTINKTNKQKTPSQLYQASPTKLGWGLGLL